MIRMKPEIKSDRFFLLNSTVTLERMFYQPELIFGLHLFFQVNSPQNCGRRKVFEEEGSVKYKRANPEKSREDRTFL